MNINDVWHSRMTKITQHAEAKLTQNNQKMSKPIRKIGTEKRHLLKLFWPNYLETTVKIVICLGIKLFCFSR